MPADTGAISKPPLPQGARGPMVYVAIANVMAELAKEGIGKDNRNSAQGYNFRGVDDVYNALAPILSASHLIIVPHVLSRECEPRQTAKGGVMYAVSCQVEFKLISAEDGSSIIATTYGEAMDSGDKATNKAMSAAYKYMAFQTFCIPTEGDNDADSHSPSESAPSGPISKAQIAQILEMADSVGADIEKFCEYLKVDSVATISLRQFPQAISALEAKKTRGAK